LRSLHIHLFKILILTAGIGLLTVQAQDRHHSREELLSIQVENQSLRQVLDSLGKTAGVEFIYADDLVKDKSISLELRNTPLDSLLAEILKPLNLEVKAVGHRQWVVYRGKRVRGTVRGRVIDSLTGEPLYFANVFLSNTFWGCATDREGGFEIPRIPPGSYQLVASMIGYEMGETEVYLSSSATLDVDFRLRPKALEMPALKVSAEPDPHWNKRLERFIRLFLGSTRNASQCRFLNPGVLDFREDKETKSFSARAGRPLIIENLALGYRLHYLLQDFLALGSHYHQFMGKVRFELMEPKNDRVARIWEGNRKETYTGSSKHFFAALASARLKEQGFEVVYIPPSLVMNHPGYSYNADWRERKYRLLSRPILQGREGAYLPSEWGEPGGEGGSIRSGKMPWEVLLCSTGFIEVRYDGTVSLLELKRETVTVHSSGYTYEPYAVSISGHWAREGVADLLPIEYSPSGLN
jgi:hypothetical protein